MIRSIQAARTTAVGAWAEFKVQLGANANGTVAAATTTTVKLAA